MAVQCARVFTGQQFSEGLATVLLDQEKIVGIQTGHAGLNESWQVVEYPGGRPACPITASSESFTSGVWRGVRQPLQSRRTES
jgi:hypothetical protein